MCQTEAVRVRGDHERGSLGATISVVAEVFTSQSHNYVSGTTAHVLGSYVPPSELRVIRVMRTGVRDHDRRQAPEGRAVNVKRGHVK